MTDAIREKLVSIGLNLEAHDAARQIEREIFETVIGDDDPATRKTKVVSAIRSAIFDGMVRAYDLQAEIMSSLISDHDIDRKTISILVDQALDAKAMIQHLSPYRDELIKIAAQIDDEKDPFAVWETVDYLIRSNDRIKVELEDVKGRLQISRRAVFEASKERDELRQKIDAINAESMPPIPPIEAYEEN